MKLFCTLSDKNYLANGLVLYESIAHQIQEDFFLYYLCLDNVTYDTISDINDYGIVPVHIKDLEKLEPVVFQDLRKNHESRPIDTSDGQSQFHWALASVFTNHLLQGNTHCLYIDSDILFYKNPSILFDSVENHDIGLVTHKHVPLNKQSPNVGYYNVGVIYFANTAFGTGCCRWWRDVVVDTSNPWYHPFGSCGDQKYLEIFENMFPYAKIKIMDNDIGHGAPWNLGPSTINIANQIKWESHLVIPNTIHTTQDLVFFHFSHFTYNTKYWSHQRKNEWGDVLDSKEKTEIYEDYFAKIRNTIRKYEL